MTVSIQNYLNSIDYSRVAITLAAGAAVGIPVYFLRVMDELKKLPKNTCTNKELFLKERTKIHKISLETAFGVATVAMLVAYVAIGFIDHSIEPSSLPVRMPTPLEFDELYKEIINLCQQLTDLDLSFEIKKKAENAAYYLRIAFNNYQLKLIDADLLIAAATKCRDGLLDLLATIQK